MEIECMPFLLVTANVGSVFEDPTRLLKEWIKELLSKISLLRPQFLALHLQEVGGKTYEKSMEYVQEFIQNLCDSEELAEYTIVRIYLDEDYNSAEHFTALGNLYFVHQSLHTVKIWNFLTHEWELAEGKSIHTGNIEAIPTKEKAKFPQHFFPECKWSRKGFLRTRWELNCTVIDFVNIHLFHDASNLEACEEFPSVYCKTRRRALVYTLERFHTDTRNGVAPYFVFGDFNFRCDTEGVIKKLTNDLTAHRVQSLKNDSTKLQFRNSEGSNVLTVGKKEFSHADHQSKFKEPWLQQFDRELEPLREVLVEYPITFPPSYPYEEDPTMPRNYMSTRCPAWCDRILLSPQARDFVDDGAFSCTDYNIIGENVCMGDHKPVYLSIHVKTLQGTVRCCHCFEHASQSSIVDLKHVESLAQDRAYCLYKSFEFNKILVECRKLDNSLICQKAFVHSGEMIGGPVATDRHPLVSINVTDTDNFNVCMCSEYLEKLDQSEDMVDGSICPQCRNIIKMQSVEHRKTLISKRLMLSENIIVNRVEMQYLSTYLDNRYEPYTPESAESRSPCPELEISNVPDEFLEDHCAMNIGSQDYTDSSPRGVVSPRQLKSKLETLQRTSLCSELDDIEYKSMKRVSCFDRCCLVM